MRQKRVMMKDDGQVVGNIPESHADLNTPIVKIFLVLVHLNFTRTPNLAEIVRESIADFANELVELGLPFVADFLDVGFCGLKIAHVLFQLFSGPRNLLFALLVSFNGSRIPLRHQL